MGTSYPKRRRGTNGFILALRLRQIPVYIKNQQEIRNEREEDQSRLSLHLAGVSAAWRLPGLQSLPPRPGREDHLREEAGEVRECGGVLTQRRRGKRGETAPIAPELDTD